ncbi:MAG: putative ABC transport system permease protein [Marinobacter excellens HL-55]|uniref:Putative ABC transport system permease protein n=1 Tax=Marinobacter excellens HL-55 TaxID=1305731 RepID=A0A0P7Z6J0_9GAMM|nr:MAG: putative ABC transport system permease protein [Marinobacter excellens HL-55]
MVISSVVSSKQSSPAHGNVELNGNTLTVSGNWTLPHYALIKQKVSDIHRAHPDAADLDLDQLDRVDTAGAALIAKLLGAETLLSALEKSTLADEQIQLLKAVAQAMTQGTYQPPRINPVRLFLARIGEKVTAIARLVWILAGFIGQTLATLFYILPRPGRWRFTPFVAAVHDTGLNALPIVALLTFLVGAVVAFLGATVLDDFGATIYTVNLVAFSFLREFGVLLAAILLAGRTASSFTAQIGSMKVNEELDAIRTLGLNPVELLVVPRVLAMMLSLPVLTFVGMISGMVGGAMVCALVLDIPLSQFMAIVERDIALKHFLVGIGKAPVFAFLIAVIGCLEGFKVAGSAQSVGEHTTSSVVQSIFMVILLDSIAALFFMEMGW